VRSPACGARELHIAVAGELPQASYGFRLEAVRSPAIVTRKPSVENRVIGLMRKPVDEISPRGWHIETIGLIRPSR